MTAAISAANFAAIACSQMQSICSFASTISLCLETAIGLGTQMDTQKEWQCPYHDNVIWDLGDDALLFFDFVRKMLKC